MADSESQLRAQSKSILGDEYSAIDIFLKASRVRMSKLTGERRGKDRIVEERANGLSDGGQESGNNICMKKGSKGFYPKGKRIISNLAIYLIEYLQKTFISISVNLQFCWECLGL